MLGERKPELQEIHISEVQTLLNGWGIIHKDRSTLDSFFLIQALSQAKISKKELRLSKAAGRLFVRVNKMINRMDPLLDRLGKEKAYRQKILDAGEAKDKTK